MGMDLILLPFTGEDNNQNFSLDILTTDRDYNLQEKIRQLDSFNIPRNFNSYLGAHGYGYTSNDAYDNRLNYTTIEELLKIKKFINKQGSYRNKAIWAYLTKLPLKTKVALYWD